jgi:hypothetical protein
MKKGKKRRQAQSIPRDPKGSGTRAPATGAPRVKWKTPSPEWHAKACPTHLPGSVRGLKT